MKLKTLCAAAFVVAGGETVSASAQDVLTGDTRLACEAILCLSSGTRPSECDPSLTRYFSIHKRKLSDTIKARLNFLNLCPVSDQTPEMQSLISAISQGAGRCDAQSLNVTLRYLTGTDDGQFYISDQLPDYCAVYVQHQYTDFADTTMPRYIGTPEQGGYWVEARDYELALAEYNARLAEENQTENPQGNYWWR